MRAAIAGTTTTLALAAAIMLSSCGSSSSQSTSATQSTSPAAPQSSSASTASSTANSSAATAATTGSATSTSQLANGNFNSCSVVTQAEAASALGQPVTAGVLGNATVEGGLACVFYGPSARTPHTPNVTQADSVRVVVVKGPHAKTWYSDYKSKVNAQPISGLGGEAFWDGFASLSVLKGDAYLRIAVAPAGAPPSLAAEKQLAAVILPRL